jgi:hypothetical protein
VTARDDLIRCGLNPDDHRPTHIIDRPGDRKSRCGVKDPLPYVAAHAVQRHVDGHGMAVCPECAVGVWPT